METNKNATIQQQANPTDETRRLTRADFDEASEAMNEAAERLDEILFEYMRGLYPARKDVNRTLYEIARVRVLLDTVEPMIVAYMKEAVL